MAQQKLLKDVATTLQSLGIEFMLTGSHASSLQGEARSTHDIDLVVDLQLSHVQPLLQAFAGDRFYLSESALTEAIRSKRTFNLLESATGEKVDFWVLSETPFNQSRFARRRPIDIGGLTLCISSPEDTILMKLSWCRQLGGSEKQFHDVLGVYELQFDLLDQEYLQKWVAALGVEDLWQRVVDEAEPIQMPERE
jgi:hypothetical protein